MSWFGIAELISTILDKIIPDRDAREKAKAELLLLEAKGELDNMKNQLKINEKEAEHSSIFVAGWRPFIGWVCGISFAYHFLALPIIMLFGVPMPTFDMNSLLTVLLGMLGLGGMRSFEKYKGVARKKVKE